MTHKEAPTPSEADSGLEGNPERLLGNAIYTHEAWERSSATAAPAETYDERRDRLAIDAHYSQIEKEMERGLS